jgi:signal transduction histidine kinase
VIDSREKTELTAKYSHHPLNADYLEMVAHDLRNRVNTLLMANEILQYELKGVKEDVLKYTDVIRESSDGILTILEAAIEAVGDKKDT